MTTIRIVSILLMIILAARADDSQKIRSVLRGFNEAVRRPERQSFRVLFTGEVDYRDALRTLKGSDALISLFSNRQIWSERTPPVLEEESIRVVGPSVAFVDAQFIQYGSTILKSAVPVVLLLEKEEDRWRISSWRMLSWYIPLSPP